MARRIGSRQVARDTAQEEVSSGLLEVLEAKKTTGLGLARGCLVMYVSNV